MKSKLKNILERFLECRGTGMPEEFQMGSHHADLKVANVDHSIPKRLLYPFLGENIYGYGRSNLTVSKNTTQPNGSHLIVGTIEFMYHTCEKCEPKNLIFSVTLSVEDNHYECQSHLRKEDKLNNVIYRNNNIIEDERFTELLYQIFYRLV